MCQRRFFSLLAMVAILSMVLSPVASAAAPSAGSTANWRVQSPTADGAQKTPASNRLIVQLSAPPLTVAYQTSPQVAAASVNGRLDVQASAAQAYVAQLQAAQAAFVTTMQAAAPGAAVSTFVNETGARRAATYQVAFNGVAVDAGPLGRDEVRTRLQRMPGVKAVYLDRSYETQLYTSTTLINAPVVWNALGGVANAGAGIKVASMDGGVHKDAPMFSGAGYSYPAGFGPNGLGLTANNNGKIIVSRAYFRSWDPPAAGDENPWPGVAGTSHGVHTASTAAGNCVDDALYLGLNVGTLCGVAPKAYVMSYRVFYESVNGVGSFFTVEGLAALEDIVADGADVVNNSWGGGPGSSGGEFDPLDQALINASKAGVFVSMSAGNAGPGSATSDHPSADYISVAASTTSGSIASGRVGVKGSADIQDLAFSTAGFGATLPLAVVQEFPYLPSMVADPANVRGCNPWPAGTFTGKAALVIRGDCQFSQKVYRAQQAGAAFVVIYNHAAGGDSLINMSPGAFAEDVTISSIFIGNTDGTNMVTYYEANVASNPTFVLDTVAFQAGATPDVLASFSSRGPGAGNVLKPDITAPGVNIMAQGYAEGVTGEARHLGYGQASGTSMAAPHIAGSAALLRQLHPDWSNADIKSALMSTSSMEVYDNDGSPAQPLDMGAGRVNLAAAMDPGVILSPPSLSFGLVAAGSSKSITVQVKNVGSSAETYVVSTLAYTNSFTSTTAMAGLSADVASVSLQPGETKPVVVTFDSAQAAGEGDNQGFLMLTGATHKAHLPAWGRVVNPAPIADVLILDNDFSTLAPLLGAFYEDYVRYYTQTLDQLGITYEVWDVDANFGAATSIPDPATLSRYKAILYFSGENFNANNAFAIPIGLTVQDMDRLVEYLNNGGSVLAMGQDMSAIINTDETDSANPPFFWDANLGANWLQDSISDEEPPTAPIIPDNAAPSSLKGLSIDVSQPSIFDASGVLTGTEQVPSVATNASGEFELHYHVDGNMLWVDVTVTPAISEPITVTASHIHMGAAGANGPVVRDLMPPTGIVTDSLSFSSVISDLTPAEVDAMLNGDLYVNVHTSNFPSGEIRGQILPEPTFNQLYIDEVANVKFGGNGNITPPPGTPGDSQPSIPWLMYAGPNNKYHGTVSLLHRNQPSLEVPGITYQGRAGYASFGLEHINESGGSSRADVLGDMLKWAWSEPGIVSVAETAAASAATVNAGNSTALALLAADYAPVIMPPAATVITPTAELYRWDFGDGTPFVTTDRPDVGHEYTCLAEPAANVFTVRTEITDSLGNVAIGTGTVDLRTVCVAPTALNTDAEPAAPSLPFRNYLPLLTR